MKCFVTPVITGGTGVIIKGLKKVETIPQKHLTDSVQKRKPY
jgi:hypothetical protein